jgi:exodeoxyribonuclease VIII
MSKRGKDENVVDLMTKLKESLQQGQRADAADAARRDPPPASQQAKVEPKWGVHDGLPFWTYLQWDAFGSGTVREVGRSPAHLRAHLEYGKDVAAARARMGSAVHACVLEPDTEWQRYFPLPEGVDRRSKIYKEAVVEFGKDFVLRHDEYASALRIRDRLFSHSRVARLLQSGRPEVSFAWRDEATDVPLKGRADWISDRIPGGAVLDLKTTGDAREHRFRRIATDFGYAVQGAHYTSGLQAWDEDVQHYCVVAVEIDPPHEVTLFQIATADMMIAQEVWRAHLDLLAHCLETDTWPGYPEQTHVLHMGPYWQTDMQARVASINDYLKEVD